MSILKKDAEQMKNGTSVINLKFEALEIKEDSANETATIVGLSAAFGNLDSYNEVIEQGAFEETIKSAPVWPVLRNHDSFDKIGFSENPVETSKGLRTDSVISLGTQSGKDQVALSKLAFKMGGKDAQSIGFMVKDFRVEETKKDGRVKFLTKIDMWEHSFVTWGANPKAFSSGFKAWIQGRDVKSLGLGDHVDEFLKFMESCGYKHADVIEIVLKEEKEKQASKSLLSLMQDSISIFNTNKG